jgi:tetratricopeptide (TPR) repeat protein
MATLDEAIIEWRRITETQRVAVVLDNAAGEEQVRPVLTSLNVVVIVTSRRSLSGLANVQRITLGSLTRAESRQLIGRIVPANQRTDEDTDQLAAACGDLPLALRIAANRVAAQPRSTIRDFLDRMATRREPLRALVAGDLAVESTLTLSYDQIGAESRRLFRSLSLIDGPTFDAHLAAATTAADPDETADRLDELTDLGLVEARGGNRYHLHDLVKLFSAALSRREDSDAAGQRDALRHWVLNTAQNAGLWFEPDREPDARAPGRHFSDSDEAASWLRIEGAQWATAIQQAFAMREDQLVLDVAEALHWFSDTWPAWDLWRILFLTSADAASRSGSDRDVAVHHGYAAWVHLSNDEFDAALESAETAVAAAHRADDTKELGWALFYLAWAQGRLQDFASALTTAATALESFAAAGDQDGVTQTLALTGNLMSRTGQLQAAVSHYEHILELLDQRRDALPANILLVTGATTKAVLARALTDSGEPQYAFDTMPDVIRESEQANYDDGAARAHLELARAAKATGNSDLFHEHITVAQRIATDHRLLHHLPRIEQLLAGPLPLTAE